MHILVTGGFGFIGGRVAQQFYSAGCKVDLGTRKNVDPPEWLPGACVKQMRWNDSENLEFNCKKIDIIVHASGMNAQDCQRDPLGALEVNGMNTARLVQAAIKAGVKKLIYLSTAHVYGNPLKGVIDESTCPANLHPYASSHRIGEDFVLAAGQRKQIEAIVLRISNGFGSPTHRDVDCWKLLVNDLCRQVVSSGELRLRTLGFQTRDFVTVSDICSAIEYIGKSNTSIRNLDYPWDLFNLGCGTTASILEMTQFVQSRVSKTMGFKPAIILPESKYASPKSSNFEYRVQKIINTGFNMINNVKEEIDNLLQFCKINF